MYGYSEQLIFDEYDLMITLEIQKRSGAYNNQELVMHLQRNLI